MLMIDRLLALIPESFKARIREPIARAGLAFARLSEREKAVVLGVAVWLATLIFVFTTYGIITGIDGTRKRVAYKTEQLSQVIALREVYRRAEERNAGQRSRLERNDLRLVGLVEDEAKKLGIEASNINPHDGEAENGVKTQLVDLRASKLSYDKVTTYLEHLESNPNPVRVVKLHLTQRFDEKDLVDMELTVATYKGG
jgi:hypothetical protein